MERILYSTAREKNITIFSVSHRKSVWKYHEFIFKFDGRGGSSFDKNEEYEY